MNRTHNNGELRLEHVGQVVELKGSYVNRGDYFTCEELAKENEYTARINYILIEEINIIEDY